MYFQKWKDVNVQFLSIAPYWNWNKVLSLLRSVLSHFQSHHTGIEIEDLLIGIMIDAAFQSHHTGIEMIFRKRWVRILLYFQSHHTGIEISTHFSILKCVSPFNRTILELKFVSTDFYLPFVGLSIAPYWNWNWIVTFIGFQNLPSFNRTILELKSSAIYFDSKWYNLSIAPYWNWNGVKRNRTNLPASLSIAPYWNWNLKIIWSSLN